jgi:uncharacterized protein DUF3175
VSHADAQTAVAARHPVCDRSSASPPVSGIDRGGKRIGSTAAATARADCRPSRGDAMNTSKARRWSQAVTRHSNALDLGRDVFAQADPKRIARSLKRSADRSQRRKSSPFRSAMSMLTFYINRAGDQLSST